MAVNYVIVSRGNPSDKEAPKKYYAQAKSSGELTFRKLCKEVADASTTVSDTDVMAVINDLIKIAKRHLSDGEIVRLGDLGTFQISVSSEGAESEEKFHHSLIKNPKILYRPGIDMKDMLATLKYERTK